MTKLDLEPCPFCGSAAEKWDKADARSCEGVGPWVFVGCKNRTCPVKPSVSVHPYVWQSGRGTFYQPEDVAAIVVRWNTRA